MDTPASTPVQDVGTLVEDAHALLTATADVAEEKVSEARKRLAAALARSKGAVDRVREEGKEMYDRAREKAVEQVHAAGAAVKEHPYEAIAIGVGVGALLGFLLARQCAGRRE